MSPVLLDLCNQNSANYLSFPSCAMSSKALFTWLPRFSDQVVFINFHADQRLIFQFLKCKMDQTSQSIKWAEIKTVAVDCAIYSMFWVLSVSDVGENPKNWELFNSFMITVMLKQMLQLLF